MRPSAAIAALLVAAWAAAPDAARAAVETTPPAVPDAERSEVAPSIRRAIAALDDEDVATAQGIVEPLLQRFGNLAPVQTMAGILRFHEQRYAESVELLEKGNLPTGSIDYLAIAKAARDLVKDHARAESEHFVVSYPKGKDEVLVPYVLDALEAQRRALTEDLGWAPASGKVVIEILNDTRELARISTLTEEEIKTSGTIALCKFNKLMVVSPKALVKGYDWLDTAAHEYTHFVVTARTKNNTPIWLHEGLAKYSEPRWRGSAGELSAWSAGLLADAVKKNDLVTFEQMHPSMAKLPSQEKAALAFAQVMVAVEYLQKQGGRPLMNKVLDLVAEGTPAEKAVAQALSVPFETFLADWKKYMAARPLPPGARDDQKLRFKGDPKHGGSHSEWAEIPDHTARGHARLGEIFRERGRWGAARVQYGKAVERVGKTYPVLTGKYALAAMMTGHEGEAEGALKEALGRHPQYAALHLGIARLYVKKKSWEPAKRHLLEANATDPFDPEIHAGLAQAFEALGDAGSASREKRFAQLLAGGEAHGPHDNGK